MTTNRSIRTEVGTLPTSNLNKILGRNDRGGNAHRAAVAELKRRQRRNQRSAQRRDAREDAR